MSAKTEMMNCEDYKKALTADPEFEDDSGHAASCAPCQAYRNELLALDTRLKAALEIDVPEFKMPELPDLDTDNVIAMTGRRSLSKPTWLALAASVLLAAVIGIRMTDTGESYGTLESQVLAHLDHERGSLQVTSTPVSDSGLLRAVPENVASMNHDAGLITYAQSCSINGKKVPHLVIQGEYGPITILLMPDEEVAKASSFEGVNTQGIILPVGGGSIAIIGEREERLDRVKQNVLDSVTWDT
jgi:hypothetical protein